jgi:hypothetical protein
MNQIQSVEGRNGQMASVLWEARYILFIDHLKKGHPINSKVLHGVIRVLKR